MVRKRAEHTATVLLSGNVLVVGGSDGSSDIAAAELYDVATKSFASSGEFITARKGHTSTLLPTGKVLIAGGYKEGYGYLSSASLMTQDT